MKIQLVCLAKGPDQLKLFCILALQEPAPTFRLEGVLAGQDYVPLHPVVMSRPMNCLARALRIHAIAAPHTAGPATRRTEKRKNVIVAFLS